jgi:predicted kinase
LSNLARLNDRLTAFDCLEFDPALRNVDVYADVAFLVMDLCVRGAEPLAYAFLDGYLDQSGDYEGAPLLPLFAEYRSVVRAKVAALRHAQTQAESDVAKLRRHLDWASQRLERGSGALWVTCGLSGSGKSYWGAQLVAPLQALRLRSDVLRKATHGLARDAASQSGIGAGIYSPDSSGAVYAQLAAIAEDLLSQGENVLIDAACLTRAQRAVFSEAAGRVGACCTVLYFTAPQEVLRKRIDARRTEGRDPSEADTGVLAWQLERLEVPGPDEPTIVVETEGLELADVLARL